MLEKDKNDRHSQSASPARSLTRCSLRILFLITGLYHSSVFQVGSPRIAQAHTAGRSICWKLNQVCLAPKPAFSTERPGASTSLPPQVQQVKLASGSWVETASFRVGQGSVPRMLRPAASRCLCLGALSCKVCSRDVRECPAQTLKHSRRSITAFGVPGA